MSVHLARHIQPIKGNHNAGESFVAKKLNNLAPAPIGSLAIMGVPHLREVAYDLYSKNIDAFMFATKVGKKVFAQATGFQDYYPDTMTIPLQPYPVAFAPRAKLSADQIDKFAMLLGPGTSKRVIGNTVEFKVDLPRLELRSKYVQAASPTYNAGNKSFSPDGYNAYIKCMGLIELFLATNWYPAFSSLNSDIAEGVPEHALTHIGAINKKKKEFFYEYRELDGNAEELGELNPTMKRRKMEEGRANEDEKKMLVERREVEFHESMGVMLVDEDITSTVYTAKPSGRPASINFGGAGSVPNLPGLVFPYFKDLNTPDFVTVKEIITNRFFRLFGDSTEECKVQTRLLRRGLNNLLNTEVGIQITHIMKGIDLALTTQTRLYLVFHEDRYDGFCLLGAQFSVYDSSQWIMPVSNEELKVELRKMDTHANALHILATTLSTLTPLVTSTKSTVTVEDISSPFKLREVIRERTKPNEETSKTINSALQQVIWDKPYTALSPASFHDFLKRLQRGYQVSDQDTFYIGSVTAPLDDNLYLLLGTFGPEAPALWNTSGEIYHVLSDSKRKVGVTTPPDDVRTKCPDEVVVRTQTLKQAHKLWLEKILETECVTFNAKERAKGHTNMVIRDKEAREGIWETLQTIMIARREDGPRQKKQKVVIDEDAVVATADDLLDLFAN